MNLILILVGLFVVLWLLVTLLERFAGNQDPAKYAALSKWLYPLLALSLILQLLFFYLN